MWVHHLSTRVVINFAKQGFIDHLEKLPKKFSGLYPVMLAEDGHAFNPGHISFGALGDSTYEYFVKMWILTGKQSTQYQRMYVEAIDAMIQRLLVKSQGGLW